MKDLSYKTAITRKQISAPLKEIIGKWLIKKSNSVLDFGCGRGTDCEWLRKNGYTADGFDPHWCPSKSALERKYDVVLCTYVLNVVDGPTQKNIIKQLKDLTNDGGKVYVSVRRDIKEHTVSERGTEQYPVTLPYRIIKENSSYCIYEI